MDTLEITFSFIFGLILGILLLFIAYVLCLKIFNNGSKDAITDNRALAILIASIFISAGYVISSVIDPLSHTVDLLKTQGYNGWNFFFQALFYTSLFSFTALSLSLATSFLGFKFFDLITRGVNEYQEIRNGNVNVAIVGGAIIFVLSLFIKFGVLQLIESFVPYPDLPVF